MNENTFSVVDPCDSVHAILAEYFGENLKSVDVVKRGNRFDCNIEYSDFKSKRQVRRELEGRYPFIDINVLTRQYTEQAFTRVLFEMFNNDETVYVKNEDGNLEKILMFNVFENMLYSRDL